MVDTNPSTRAAPSNFEILKEMTELTSRDQFDADFVDAHDLFLFDCDG